MLHIVKTLVINGLASFICGYLSQLVCVNLELVEKNISFFHHSLAGAGGHHQRQGLNSLSIDFVSYPNLYGQLPIPIVLNNVF